MREVGANYIIEIEDGLMTIRKNGGSPEPETFIVGHVQKNVCEWSYSKDEDVYNTACDGSFAFNTGTPKENMFVFCPYCAGIIITNEEKNE